MAADPNASWYTASYGGGATGGGQAELGGPYSSMNNPNPAMSGRIPRGPVTISWTSAFGTGGFDDEPPLLEGTCPTGRVRLSQLTHTSVTKNTELGINIDRITKKTLAVLHPAGKGLEREILDDDDLAGPLLFCLLFGAILLLVRFLVLSEKPKINLASRAGNFILDIFMALH